MTKKEPHSQFHQLLIDKLSDIKTPLKICQNSVSKVSDSIIKKW